MRTVCGAFISSANDCLMRFLFTYHFVQSTRLSRLTVTTLWIPCVMIEAYILICRCQALSVSFLSCAMINPMLLYWSWDNLRKPDVNVKIDKYLTKTTHKKVKIAGNLFGIWEVLMHSMPLIANARYPGMFRAMVLLTKLPCNICGLLAYSLFSILDMNSRCCAGICLKKIVTKCEINLFQCAHHRTSK